MTTASRRRHWAARVSIAFVALLVIALAAVITFDRPTPPPVLAAANQIPGIESWNFSAIPKPVGFTARDGTTLTYRAYSGAGRVVAVLIHGSSGSSFMMHALATALQQDGVSVYALDMRGHGGSGRNGDVDYIGQLDDDVVDFMQKIVGSAPAKKVLIGFSSGGGFTLRFAGSANGALFDGFVMLSPYLRYDAPTARPGIGGWTGLAIGRTVGLTILTRLGIDQFDGLPILAFATAAEAKGERTPFYSFRLSNSFAPHGDWQQDARNIARPAYVFVGDQDELFYPEQFAPTLQPLNARLSVKVLPGLHHMDMVAAPSAIAAVRRAVGVLAGQ